MDYADVTSNGVCSTARHHTPRTQTQNCRYNIYSISMNNIMNKRSFFSVLIISLLMFLTNAATSFALASEYNAIIIDSIPVVEYVRSLNETTAFVSIALSPDDFQHTVGDDAQQVYAMLEEQGIDTNPLPHISSAQSKRFTFADVYVSNSLCDIIAIRYGEAPSYLNALFMYKQGEWLLIDVLLDVESIEIVSNSANSWIKTRSSAFSDSVEIERLYNLSTRAYEINYLSHAASPLFNSEFDDGVIYISSYSTINEHSVVGDTGAVNFCYLYVVRNASLCSMDVATIIEHHAITDIDIYVYDYDRTSYSFLQTNHYEGLGAATIDSILYSEVLLSQTQIKK